MAEVVDTSLLDPYGTNNPKTDSGRHNELLSSPREHPQLVCPLLHVELGLLIRVLCSVVLCWRALLPLCIEHRHSWPHSRMMGPCIATLQRLDWPPPTTPRCQVAKYTALKNAEKQQAFKTAVTSSDAEEVVDKNAIRDQLNQERLEKHRRMFIADEVCLERKQIFNPRCLPLSQSPPGFV